MLQAVGVRARPRSRGCRLRSVHIQPSHGATTLAEVNQKRRVQESACIPEQNRHLPVGLVDSGCVLCAHAVVLHSTIFLFVWAMQTEQKRETKM